ncbi:hypothetical protein AQJ23_42010 [Streptomyces antibioticus]|nr:hypothetical protein AQJ23_42010 [Streptomyces antibioticus]
MVVRLRRPRDAEQAEARRVEDVHAELDAFDLRVQEDDQQRGEQRGDEVPQVGEGGRGYRADDQVPEQPSAQRGDLGEDGDAEDVEVLAHGQQRAGDGEDEDADQVERVLDGGGKQWLKHPTFLPMRGGEPCNARVTGPEEPVFLW